MGKTIFHLCLYVVWVFILIMKLFISGICHPEYPSECRIAPKTGQLTQILCWAFPGQSHSLCSSSFCLCNSPSAPLHRMWAICSCTSHFLFPACLWQKPWGTLLAFPWESTQPSRQGFICNSSSWITGHCASPVHSNTSKFWVIFFFNWLYVKCTDQLKPQIP